MGRPYKIKRHKRIYRRSAGNIILRVLIIVAAVAALFGIGWMLYTPVSDWISQRQNPDTAVIGESSAPSDGLDVDEQHLINRVFQKKPEPKTSSRLFYLRHRPLICQLKRLRTSRNLLRLWSLQRNRDMTAFCLT